MSSKFAKAMSATVKEPWTLEQLREEWRYVYHERIGIMCEDGEPTAEQKEIARAEANQAIEKLK
jgi:hypothetical protein